MKSKNGKSIISPIYFKSKPQYLTTEGFPTGTECYFIIITAFGHKHTICDADYNKLIPKAIKYLSDCLKTGQTFCEGDELVKELDSIREKNKNKSEMEKYFMFEDYMQEPQNET